MQRLWGEAVEEAFNAVKKAMKEVVTCRIVSGDKPFYIRTDASRYAVGAVLEQADEEGRHYPVAFWSRKLTSAPPNRTPPEQEAYAILCAVKKWASLIGLQQVTVLTDHESLEA